ncbi:MAG: extracellular solute-binding protein [Roseburia sp.]
MKKKAVALLLSATMASMCLAGCGGADETSDVAVNSDTTAPIENESDELEPCTITFWYTYGDAEEEVLLNNVIPLWNELHPDITVECVRQDSSQYDEMVVISFGTGQGPDVARIDITNTAEFAAQGGLVALSNYADFGKKSEEYLEGPLSTNLYQGSYYGLPLDTNCKAAVVNTQLLQSELGLSEIPDTMEELISAAENRGTYSISVSGFGDWDMYPYFWLFGGTLTNEDFTQASGYLDSAESVAAIEKIKDLHDKKILTIKELDGTADAWDGIESEYVMFFEGPWYGFSDKAEIGIEPARIPSYNGETTSVVGGENIAVFATSEHPNESYEFAKFMTSEEVQLLMLDAGQLPVLKTLVDHEKIQENEVWAVYMEQLETAQARIPSPNNSDIETAWKDAMTNIFLNNADVQSELSAAAEKIDSYLQ